MPPKKTPSTAAATKTRGGKKNAETKEDVTEKKMKLTEKAEAATTTKKVTRKAKKADSETDVVEKKKAKPKKEDVKEEAEEPVSSTTRKAPKRGKKTEETENGVTEPKKSKTKKETVKQTKESATSKKTAKPKAKQTKKADESDAEDTEVEAPVTKKKATKASVKETEQENTNVKPATKNATSTSWESVDFKCTKKNKNGEKPNFRITSWNVDGLRAWLKKGGLNILEFDQPEILCFQETKCSTEKLPEEITNVEGYETYWCSSEKEGYAGVGLLSKIKPLNVTYGIGSEDHDDEGRCITAEFEKFYLVNVYVPNAGRKLVTLPKRLEWNKIFKDYIKSLDEKKPVILCGDMNVAHQEIDLTNPKTNTKNAGFTPEEREGMTDFLESGYVDTFRMLYPEQEKAYTFWSYMANARAKNIGWRLDYFLVSERFVENVCDNIIYSDVLGSDHCPLALHFHL